MAERIILDTNVWVSYFIGRKFDEIALLILDSDLAVFSCEELIEEVSEVLARKKFNHLLSFEVSRYVDFLRELTIEVNIVRRFSGCPDEKDNFLFDLAIQTDAKLLVTGDKRLIEFRATPIKVITLKDFKDRYTASN